MLFRVDGKRTVDDSVSRGEREAQATSEREREREREGGERERAIFINCFHTLCPFHLGREFYRSVETRYPGGGRDQVSERTGQ